MPPSLTSQLSGSTIFIIILIILVFWFGRRAIQIVDQGTERTVLRLGRYNRTLEPGFHLVVP
ncbi:MAG: SPFH/Band 7/PHB domain protein, partial [Cardiobacterium sp.]